MRRTVWRWELASALWIALAGSAVHFAFAWTNYWRPGALVFAVNESVWEHLKLVFWPGLFFALLEYLFIRKMTSNFWLAKARQLFIMPVVIIVLFYSYMSIRGKSYFPLDISIFVLSVVIGQITSYRTLIAARARPSMHRSAAFVLVLLILAFTLWTYYPPRFPLFQDPPTHGYGIPEQVGR